MNAPKHEHPPIRRVVTGHDAHNVAKVLMDGAATNWKSSTPGTVSTLIWSTDGAPADIGIGETIEDCGARILGTAPPANGTRFAVIDFPPGKMLFDLGMCCGGMGISIQRDDLHAILLPK